jgi:hypothetical protein
MRGGWLEFGSTVEPSHGNPGLNLVVGTDSWPDLLDARNPWSRSGEWLQIDRLKDRVWVAAHLMGARWCGKTRDRWAEASRNQAWHGRAATPERAEPWQEGRRPEGGPL